MKQKNNNSTSKKRNNKPKSKNIKQKVKNSKNISKDNKNKKGFKVGIIVVSFVIVLLVILSFYYILSKEKSNEYSKKINTWGLSKLYDNNQTYSWQNVSKIEALRIVIAASTNKTNVKSLYNPKDEMSDDEIFMYYANYNNLIDDDSINNNNMNENATMLDVIMLINNSRKNILKKEITGVGNPIFSDFDIYTDIQKAYIRNLVKDEIIQNNDKKLNADKDIRKGELNKIIVNYVYKYSTFSLNGEVMIRNEEDMPKNVDEYPYVLENVPKEVYEQKNTVYDYDYYLNAADFFDIRREYYWTTVYNSNKYFDTILNVDYNTITYEGLRDSIKNYVVGRYEEDVLKEYVDYVKKNNIKITGKSTSCLPAIYNDGRRCVIRTKLEFNIESSNTKENLLCFDKMYNAKVYYDKTNYTIYIDAQMGYVSDSKLVYNQQQPVYTMLLDMSKDEIKVTNSINPYNNLLQEEGANE